MEFLRRHGREESRRESGPGLFLSCGLCGQKQVDGLLSRVWWGSVEAKGRTLHACPVCKAAHEDWAMRLAASVDESTGGADKLRRARTRNLRVLPGGGQRVGVGLPRGHLQLVKA